MSEVIDPRDNDAMRRAHQEWLGRGNPDGTTLEGHMKQILDNTPSGGDAKGADRPATSSAAVATAPKTGTKLPGDDGLFWVKHRFLGTRNRVREVAVIDDQGTSWRRIRTWCERIEFKCVAFSPDHRCPAQQAGVSNELPWVDPEDAEGAIPGSPEYEAWHIGQVRTVEFEIEPSRIKEMVIPVRGEKVTTGQLRALERQWYGAPAVSNE